MTQKSFCVLKNFIVNKAKNRPTIMSSIWKSQASSKNAVDGNADHLIAGGSCAVTKSQANPWFRLELKNQTAVSIEITVNNVLPT